MTNIMPADTKSGRIVGLARVSTTDQKSDLQTKALKAYGCDDIIIEEGVSGGMHPKDRQGYRKARGLLQQGDTLAVWKIDRLGRSLKGIIDTIDELSQRGIHFVSLTENFATDSAMGRAMMQLIGVIAQLERDMISERTKAGLQAALDRGVKLGPKYKLSDEQVREAHLSLIGNDVNIGDLAHDLGVSRQTLCRGLERIKLAA